VAQVSVYRTHALFEACRSGALESVRAVLSRADVDVNARAGAVAISALADACNRGADAVVALLLQDARTDISAGSSELSLPLEYACVRGFSTIVDLFIAADAVPLEHCGPLLERARAHGHGLVAAKLHLHRQHVCYCTRVLLYSTTLTGRGRGRQSARSGVHHQQRQLARRRRGQARPLH
jgi:hypothetical protein